MKTVKLNNGVQMPILGFGVLRQRAGRRKRHQKKRHRPQRAYCHEQTLARRRAGKIKAIGVSNFYSDRIVDFVLHNKITPAVNQIETHPFHQQKDAQKILQEYNIQIEAWGPFAEGKNNLFHNEVLEGIAKKHGKSIAQVVLHWLTQRGVVAIPKSVRKERMAENLNIFDFELDAKDNKAIATLDRKASSFFDHCDPEKVKWLGTRKLQH